jgi:hypothetical protein
MKGLAAAVVRSRWRSLLLAAAAASVTAFAAPTARATEIDWNCGVQSVGWWCLLDVRHSYYLGEAHYPGNNVCIKFIKDSDGSLYAASCATSWADLSVCGCLLLKPLTYNGGPDPHTIFGNAYY